MKKVIGFVALLAFATVANAADLGEVFDAYHNGGASAPSADFAGVQLAEADIPSEEFSSPLKVSAGSGAETRVLVDAAAVEAVSDGWPWYAKAGLVAGCIAVAGLATWAVVDACDGGRHDNDQSQRIDLRLDGEGNTLTVHFHTDEPTITRTGGN